MILLENKANVTAPNADYPYGAIKNDTGIGDGTPVDVQAYGDIHQFFARMFAQSGITANGLPDNLTNGFQLYEAFQKLAGISGWTAATITPAISTSTSGATVVFFNTGQVYSKFRIVGKTVTWNFVAGITCTGSPTSLQLTLPAAFTFPSPLPSSGGIATGCKVQTKSGIVSVSNSGATIQLYDGSALANTTGAPLSFSITLELA